MSIILQASMCVPSLIPMQTKMSWNVDLVSPTLVGLIKGRVSKCAELVNFDLVHVDLQY